MREMVLNHASLVADNRYVATEWLIGLSKGISAIRSDGIVKSPMRAGKYFDQIQCTPDATLFDLTIAMLSTKAREEAAFLMELSKKVSLLKCTNPDIEAGSACLTLVSSPDIRLSLIDADPLRYCVETDSVAVGFPSDPIWEQDQIDVYFNELSSDGEELDEVAETIDNLTLSEHAEVISQRHQDSMSDVYTTSELWARRASAFPNLLFGPDVEDHLMSVNNADLRGIVKKLRMIDRDAADWQAIDSSMPNWSGNVTPESNRVRNNPALIGERRFRSNSGSTEIFEWHARFGSGGRIHLRFDAKTKQVEIGYIGKHLPL